MAHYLELDADRLRQDPLILLVGSGHHQRPNWQELWESQCSDCRRIELGAPGGPLRNVWVNQLNLAIHQADRPVILAAQDLACLAVAWWAEYERPAYGNPVVGALFVAPPDVDRPGSDPRLAALGSCPRRKLPFPSFLAVNQDDRFGNLRTAQMLANDWGSRFVLAGAADRVGSGSADWPFGKKLLKQLLGDHRLGTAPAPAIRIHSG